ncbi:hypothetical protein OOK27_50970 [Streptomyces canus]|nr:hypothetical protein [Streptomyces canus]
MKEDRVVPFFASEAAPGTDCQGWTRRTRRRDRMPRTLTVFSMAR